MAIEKNQSHCGIELDNSIEEVQCSKRKSSWKDNFGNRWGEAGADEVNCRVKYHYSISFTLNENGTFTSEVKEKRLSWIPLESGLMSTYT